MAIIQQSEATAADRRIPFRLVSTTDGYSPVTGATVTVRVSKQGAATAAGVGTVVEVDSANDPGLYYYQATAAEVDTLGSLLITPVATGAVRATYESLVVEADPYAAPDTGTDVATEVWANAERTLTDLSPSVVQTSAAAALTAYDPPTKAELDAAAALLATPAQVRTQADAALTAYAPLTAAGYTAPNNTGIATAATNSTTLVGRVTQVRADKWDNLDTTVGSRAAAGDEMALTSATVSALVEAYLDGFSLSGTVSDTTPAADGFTGASTLSTTDNFYLDMVLVFTSGALLGIPRRVTGYTGATRTFAFETAFPSAPANGATFRLLGRIE